MKNLILYEKCDKVSLTPAYVAMRAIEESEEDVERHQIPQYNLQKPFKL